MARPSQETSVTHRFRVELTDYLEACPGARLMTRDEAREVLDGVLYRGDKHTPFTLRLTEERETPMAAPLAPEDLVRRFTYHAPATPERAEAHATVRGACAGIAAQIADLCPAGREQALAFTKLEEVMFWANAAIARTRTTEDG